MMTVTGCVDVMKRYRLPKEDFLGWTDNDRDVFCQHYYNAMEHPVWPYNPYTQGELLCESRGISRMTWKPYIRAVKEKFESYFEDDMRDLVKCSLSFL